ncbi:MAG: glucosamine-6-phosphate deaminase [Subdoligranulum sp.]|nr:glucosamine-6-phosphate deaminase [Subdoligranulum sp.]
MQLTIAKNEMAFDNIAAWKIIGEILRSNGDRTTLRLGTGRTALDIYRAMAQIYRVHPFGTARVCVFGTSELAGVPHSSPESRYRILHQAVVEPLEIFEENFFMPMPFADDPERECRAHESVIQARGGIDLLLAEPSCDGSLDLLGPGTPFGSTAFVQQDGTQKKITLGIQDMMHSRRLLLAAKGREKAPVVRQLLYGPVTEDVPASLLRTHPFLEIVLDKEAASLL